MTEPNKAAQLQQDLFDHITRRASSLRTAVYENRQLGTHQWKKAESGAGGTSTFQPINPRFALDLPNLQVGWVQYIKGEGRVETVVPYGQPKPRRPDDRASGVALVPISDGEYFLALEIADTKLVAAFKPVYNDYLDSPEYQDGLIPVVHFDNNTCSFEVVDWTERPPPFGERLDGFDPLAAKISNLRASR